MVQHEMKLKPSPFQRIQSAQKKVEIRLNDPKRQKIKAGDTIKFSNLSDLEEKLIVKVIELHNFQTFKDLIDTLPLSDFGYQPDHDKQAFLNSIYTIYTSEQEKKHNALGIRIELQ